MPQEPGSSQRRLDIAYVEGVNNLVDFTVGKPTEFYHAENARSKTIGTVEKREGQTVLGTNADGTPFVTTANYSIFNFQNTVNQGFYRISANENNLISINVEDDIFLSDTGQIDPTKLLRLTIYLDDTFTMTEQVNNANGILATIYYLDSTDSWVPLTGLGTNIPGGEFDVTYAEGCTFLVNADAANMYIDTDFVTVHDSSYAPGHLFNSPVASRVNYYKSRLYLADYVQFGVRYPTTILRSSYTMGIIALVNADTTLSMDNNGFHNYNQFPPANTFVIAVAEQIKVAESLGVGNGQVNPTPPTATPTPFPFPYSSSPLQITIVNGVTTLVPQSIPVTDTTYFYTNPGANSYDIYRGGNFVANLVVSAITQTTISGILTAPGQIPSFDLQAADEIWIAGTYTGTKVFRWVNNSSVVGRDVKQYDTFKLSGGENDPITMMINVGNIMIISNKSAMTTWNDYTIENFDLDVGCVSKQGYVKVLGALYFIHYTGIYTTSGAVPQIISNKVQKYIQGATKAGLEASAAGKKGRNIFFTIGDVTLYKQDGSINKICKDVCLEYNIIQENWYIHTNVKASEFATFVETINPDRLELADTSGNHAIKEFLHGETDDGEIIHFRVDTQKLTLQPANFEYSNNLVALLVETERGSSMQVFANLEKNNPVEEYYPIQGNIRKGLSIIKFSEKDGFRGQPPICRLVSVSIRDSSKQRCKIARMSVIFIPTTEEIRDNDIDY